MSNSTSQLTACLVRRNGEPQIVFSVPTTEGGESDTCRLLHERLPILQDDDEKMTLFDITNSVRSTGGLRSDMQGVMAACKASHDTFCSMRGASDHVNSDCEVGSAIGAAIAKQISDHNESVLEVALASTYNDRDNEPSNVTSRLLKMNLLAPDIFRIVLDLTKKKLLIPLRIVDDYIREGEGSESFLWSEEGDTRHQKEVSVIKDVLGRTAGVTRKQVDIWLPEVRSDPTYSDAARTDSVPLAIAGMSLPEITALRTNILRLSRSGSCDAACQISHEAWRPFYSSVRGMTDPMEVLSALQEWSATVTKLEADRQISWNKAIRDARKLVLGEAPG